ncbi:MAG TPA: hypothetical protein VH253_20170 [Phycisphaerae bacterium]|nr:hypothetical protein [Phycisphaerae bacterium]
MRTSPTTALLLSLTLLTPAAALAAPEPLPTMDQITAMVNAHQSREALAAIARVIDLRGPAAAPYDRHNLLILKADAQLQNHDNSGALATLALAQKETNDDDQIAQTTALTELIKKSPGGHYTPKTPGSAPIDIADRAKRKDAYQALATDELTVLQAQAKSAANATSLAPLANLAKQAAPIRALEFAATGKTTQVDAVTAQLAAAAQKLMTNVLEKLSLQVEQISSNANKQIVVTVPMNFRGGASAPVQEARPTGLTQTDIQNLHNIQNECDQVPPAVKSMQLAFGDEKGFAPISARAAQIKARAQTILTTDYGGLGLGGPTVIR